MTSAESESQRIIDATQLVDDYNLQEDAEYFAAPSTRVEFVESLSADDFFDIAQHVNARMRGHEPRERANATDKGGYLPLLGTPEVDEKPTAFREGFNTIRQYLMESDDSPEQKVKGAAMATEALVIWVHPFNDGNGRTSRFLGKLIEDGTVDTEQLIAETANKNNRLRVYDETLRIDQANVVKGLDLLLDDEQEAAIKKTEMPVAQGISLSLKKLLENKSLQERVEKRAAHHRDLLEKNRARLAAV